MEGNVENDLGTPLLDAIADDVDALEDISTGLLDGIADDHDVQQQPSAQEQALRRSSISEEALEGEWSGACMMHMRARA